MAILSVHAPCDPSRLSGPDIAQPLVAQLIDSIDNRSQAAGQNLEFLLARLLFAARGLANAHIKSSRPLEYEEPLVYCDECQHAALLDKLTHAPSCRTGSVLEILACICESRPATGRPVPNRRREDACAADNAGLEYGEPWEAGWTDHLTRANVISLFSAEGYRLADLAGAPAEAREHAERVAVCVNFCAGISTETLRHELPLASADRRRWSEIRHLRVALPWLPVLPTEADDKAVLL